MTPLRQASGGATGTASTPADPRSAQNVLDTLKYWPAEHIAASVLAPDVIAEFGDRTRQFRLMSVTKLLTTWAVMVAVEEGIFELDDDLGPERSTVRHLMSHASGVAFGRPVVEKPVEQRRIYSSAGMDIVADKIAAEAGMPFAQYLDEAVLQPLGMTDTYLEGSAGHGGVSTVADVEKFAAEIFDPQLLHADTVDEIFTEQFPELDGVVPGYGMMRPSHWGIGFAMFGGGTPNKPARLWFGDNMPADMAGHFGQSGTFMWIHRSTRRAAIVLTDRDFGEWAKPLWSKFNYELWAAVEPRG